MEQALINLAFEDGLCRVVMREDEPWFVAKDVCRVLEIVNHRDAVGVLDDDEKGVASTNTLTEDGVGLTDAMGRSQDMLIVSESGLYTLIVRSRAATTPGTVQHRFRKWVFGEVLPQIRKTGSYTVPADGPQWDIEAIGFKLALIKETRLTLGRKAAAALWPELGLPMAGVVRPNTSAPSQGVDFVQKFLDDRTEEAPGGRVGATELKSAFDRWVADTGAPSMTMTMFGRTLSALGVERSRSHVVYYTGIRIKHRTEVTG